MPTKPIIFYELASKTNEAWSPNTWRVRFVLNYKQIPYKSEIISFADIESKMKAIGAKPTGKRPDTGAPMYTIPVIVIPAEDGGTPTIVVDSIKIVEYLDKKYPSPPIFPNGSHALQGIFDDWLRRVITSQELNILLPSVATILDERGLVYFRETREKWFGKPVEELAPEGEKRDAVWKEVQNAWGKLADILDKEGNEGWFMGNEPVFADFAVLSHIVWIQRTVPTKLWEDFKTWHGGRWAKMLEKAKGYLQED